MNTNNQVAVTSQREAQEEIVQGRRQTFFSSSLLPDLHLPMYYGHLLRERHLPLDLMYAVNGIRPPAWMYGNTYSRGVTFPPPVVHTIDMKFRQEVIANLRNFDKDKLSKRS